LDFDLGGSLTKSGGLTLKNRIKTDFFIRNPMLSDFSVLIRVPLLFGIKKLTVIYYYLGFLCSPSVFLSGSAALPFSLLTGEPVLILFGEGFG
jgi:hypothetical protein